MAKLTVAAVQENDAVVSEGCANQAVALARQLNLPCTDYQQALLDYEFILGFSPDGLALILNRPDSPGSACVDFANPRLEYRINDRVRRQGIARAVGVKPGLVSRVLDATAGLGQDAFILASSGCRVHMLEKNPVIAALLNDGLQRARSSGDDGLRRTVQHLEMSQADLLDFSCAGKEFDVVYLDPMFPKRRKSARVKKAMYVLQQYFAEYGESVDDKKLLQQALEIASRRVVVKRPVHAPDVGALSPTFRLPGRSSRFDVYVTGSA